MSQYRAGIKPERPAKAHELVHVDASLSAFDSADEGLILTVGDSQVRLRHVELAPPRILQAPYEQPEGSGSDMSLRSASLGRAPATGL